MSWMQNVTVRRAWCMGALLAMGLCVSWLPAHGAGRYIPELEYARVKDEPLLLDLYLPENPKNVPLVVWLHGGGWLKGTKEDCPAQFLTEHGFAVASINYRLAPMSRFPAQIHDAKAAVRWLRASAKKYNVNPNRIGAWGESAGGHLAAMLGTTGNVKAMEGTVGTTQVSSRVQAVCSISSPTDLVEAVTVTPTAHNYEAVEMTVNLLGGKNTTKAKQASPITYVTKDDPPFLFLHGGADLLVPMTQSKRMNQALVNKGVKSQLVVLPTIGHGGEAFFSPENQAIVVAFLKKYLMSAK